MKKKLSTIMMLLASLLPMNAQNLQKGDYGYLYCHMSDKGEYTAFAVSRDGYNYQDINEGKAIFIISSIWYNENYPAGVVQRLVCKFSKLETRVRFSPPAPK